MVYSPRKTAMQDQDSIEAEQSSIVPAPCEEMSQPSEPSDAATIWTPGPNFSGDEALVLQNLKQTSKLSQEDVFKIRNRRIAYFLEKSSAESPMLPGTFPDTKLSSARVRLRFNDIQTQIHPAELRGWSLYQDQRFGEAFEQFYSLLKKSYGNSTMDIPEAGRQTIHCLLSCNQKSQQSKALLAADRLIYILSGGENCEIPANHEDAIAMRAIVAGFAVYTDPCLSRPSTNYYRRLAHSYISKQGSVPLPAKFRIEYKTYLCLLTAHTRYLLSIGADLTFLNSNTRSISAIWTYSVTRIQRVLEWFQNHVEQDDKWLDENHSAADFNVLNFARMLQLRRSLYERMLRWALEERSQDANTDILCIQFQSEAACCQLSLKESLAIIAQIILPDQGLSTLLPDSTGDKPSNVKQILAKRLGDLSENGFHLAKICEEAVVSQSLLYSYRLKANMDIDEDLQKSLDWNAQYLATEEQDAPGLENFGSVVIEVGSARLASETQSPDEVETDNINRNKVMEPYDEKARTTVFELPGVALKAAMKTHQQRLEYVPSPLIDRISTSNNPAQAFRLLSRLSQEHDSSIRLGNVAAVGHIQGPFLAPSLHSSNSSDFRQFKTKLSAHSTTARSPMSISGRTLSQSFELMSVGS